MPQILQSKKFGEIEVEHGGWQDAGLHIVRLTNGVYCHSNGLPVSGKDEFRKAGMQGDELLKAENWFEHRHDSEETQGVVFRPDGSVVFEDGTPVTQSAQLMQCLPPGEFLDAALKALFKWQEGQKAPGLKNTRALEAAKKGLVAPKRSAIKGAKKGKSPAVAPVPGQASPVAFAG